MKRLDQRHSSCLWFQILGVEAHSFLPSDQNDGGNLPRQGQTCHLRSHPFGKQGRKGAPFYIASGNRKPTHHLAVGPVGRRAELSLH